MVIDDRIDIGCIIGVISKTHVFCPAYIGYSIPDGEYATDSMCGINVSVCSVPTDNQGAVRMIGLKQIVCVNLRENLGIVIINVQSPNSHIWSHPDRSCIDSLRCNNTGDFGG